MKVIDYKWNKRNGNGQSTCHLCNKLTWDSWCYELKVLDEELFNTILCGDCISKIKKETECKMTSNKEIIEEEKEIEELSGYADIDKNSGLACGWSFQEKILKDKINELVREINKLKKEGK